MYVGRTTSSSVRARQREPALEPGAQVGQHVDPLGRKAGVLAAQGELGGAVPRRDDALEAVEQRLEVDVPDPRDVLAVGDRVVERDHGDARRTALDERPDRLVRAGRVLDQQHQQPPLADRDPLEAAERGAEALEPGRDVVERDAERARERRGGERVVDVVEAGHAQAHATSPLRRDERERGVLEPARARSRARRRRAAGARCRRRGSGSRRGARRRRRRTRTASRTRRSTSSPRRAGATAARASGRRRRRRAFPGGLACEPAELRVVAVHRQSRVRPAAARPPRASAPRRARARRSGRAGRGRGSRGRPPAGGRARRPPAAPPRRPRTGRARRRSRRAAPRRRPTRGSRPTRCARARAAGAGSRPPSPRSSSCRSSRRSSADPRGQPLGEPVDRRRIELPEQLPRNRRPAAAAGQARKTGRRAGGEDLGCKRNAHGFESNPKGGFVPAIARTGDDAPASLPRSVLSDG